jgi:hypothetical protein
MKKTKVLFATLAISAIALLTSCGPSERELAIQDMDKIQEQIHSTTDEFEKVSNQVVSISVDLQKAVYLGVGEDVIQKWESQADELKVKQDSIQKVLDGLHKDFTKACDKVEKLPK